MSTGEATGERTIETRIPARLDRLPWSRFHWRIVIGLGTVWILDGLEVTIVGSIARRLTEEGQRARPRREPDRHRGRVLCRRRLRRCALLRPAHRPLRPQEAVPGHPRASTSSRRRDRLLLRALVLLRRPLLHRRRDRRRVRGDQLGDRRADPGPGARPGRPDHQRQLLGRRRRRVRSPRSLLLDTALFAADVGWRLAFGIGATLGVGILLVRRNVPESPRWLFIHGREEEAERDRRRDRGGGARGDRRGAPGAGGKHHGPPARADPLPRDRPNRLQDLPAPHDPRPLAVRRPGVPLQRGHLRPRHAARASSSTSPRGRSRIYIALFAVSNFLGPLHARPLLRHRRPQADDLRHLPGLGG